MSEKRKQAPTKAGMKLLQRFAEAEAAGQLKPVFDHRGHEIGHGMNLRWGDGSELLAAQKLSRDGFAKLVGGQNNVNRFVIATEAGRAALSKGA